MVRKIRLLAVVSVLRLRETHRRTCQNDTSCAMFLHIFALVLAGKVSLFMFVLISIKGKQETTGNQRNTV